MINTITLNNEEILQAITAYIVNMGVSTDNADVNIDVLKGRKGTGLKATIEITSVAPVTLVEDIEEVLPLFSESVQVA